MKVRAIEVGFYGNRRRRKGDVFDIDDKKFSKKWMEKVEPKPGKPIEGKPSKGSKKVADVNLPEGPDSDPPAPTGESTVI